jgi:hypothetical protein
VIAGARFYDADELDEGAAFVFLGHGSLFAQTDAVCVPEPAGFLMLVAGVGLLAVLYRRHVRGSRIG